MQANPANACPALAMVVKVASPGRSTLPNLGTVPLLLERDIGRFGRCVAGFRLAPARTGPGLQSSGPAGFPAAAASATVRVRTNPHPPAPKFPKFPRWPMQRLGELLWRLAPPAVFKILDPHIYWEAVSKWLFNRRRAARAGV